MQILFMQYCLQNCSIFYGLSFILLILHYLHGYNLHGDYGIQPKFNGQKIWLDSQFVSLLLDLKYEIIQIALLLLSLVGTSTSQFSDSMLQQRCVVTCIHKLSIKTRALTTSHISSTTTRIPPIFFRHLVHRILLIHPLLHPENTSLASVFSRTPTPASEQWLSHLAALALPPAGKVSRVGQDDYQQVKRYMGIRLGKEVV